MPEEPKSEPEFPLDGMAETARIQRELETQKEEFRRSLDKLQPQDVPD